ncbi:MAG: hypothetical protein ACI3XL_03870 [Eubacteriales bacterium]
MKNKINWSKVKQYLPISFTGICVVGFLIFLAFNKDFTIADFLRITRENPIYTILAVIAAFVIKGFVVFVPYAVIAITTMAVLDFPEALFAVIVGTIVNISVPYWTGRLTKDDWIQKVLDKFPKARPYYEMTDNLFLLSFTLRAMNLSNEGLGLLFGSAGLSYFPYLISSLIALAPSAISYIILGKDLNLIESLSSPVFWGAVVVDMIMVAVMTLYFRTKKKREEKEKNN